LLKLRAEIATPSWVDTKRLKRATPTKLRQYKAGAAIAGKAGLAAATIPYGIYRTAKGAIDVAKKLPSAMRESSQLMTDAPSYMAKHGGTAFDAAGALTAGSFLGKPEVGVARIGYKSLRKGLRKDVAGYIKRSQSRTEATNQVMPIYKGVMEGLAKITSKNYRHIKSVGLEPGSPDFYAEYVHPLKSYLDKYGRIRANERETFKTAGGRNLTPPAIAFNTATGSFPNNWTDTLLHELEHSKHDPKTFPTARNILMREIDKVVNKEVPADEAYDFSVKEYIANNTAKVLAATDTDRKITPKMWDRISDFYKNTALARKNSERWTELISEPEYDALIEKSWEMMRKRAKVAKR